MLILEGFRHLEAFASELFIPLPLPYMKFTCRKTHVVTYTCDSAHVKFHV